MTPIKKYTIKWSIWAFNEDIPPLIQKIQGWIKTSAFPATITTWATADPTWAMIIAGGLWAADLALHFTYLEERKDG